MKVTGSGVNENVVGLSKMGSPFVYTGIKIWSWSPVVTRLFRRDTGGDKPDQTLLLHQE